MALLTYGNIGETKSESLEIRVSYEAIQKQLDEHRRVVSFDSYDLAARQLIDMLVKHDIDIAPEYQRHFKWDDVRQSQLIESLFLGIPVPSLYMATNKDSSWEVVDGLQRLTTIVNFAGEEAAVKEVGTAKKKLKLTGLEKLTALNGLTFEELPRSLQVMFLNRPLRVTVLNDRSDFAVRYDLFERLNTGGVSLTPQEIRNCIFLGEFNDFIKRCALNKNLRAVVKIPEDGGKGVNFEELALRFFAYYEYRDSFVHGVQEFLNDYMHMKTEDFKNLKQLKVVFDETFAALAKHLPSGIVRATRKNVTPIILYEAIAVGAAVALQSGDADISEIGKLLDDAKLKRLTTGATNSRKMVKERIDFVCNKVSGL